MPRTVLRVNTPVEIDLFCVSTPQEIKVNGEFLEISFAEKEKEKPGISCIPSEIYPGETMIQINNQCILTISRKIIINMVRDFLALKDCEYKDSDRYTSESTVEWTIGCLPPKTIYSNLEYHCLGELFTILDLFTTKSNMVTFTFDVNFCKKFAGS